MVSGSASSALSLRIISEIPVGQRERFLGAALPANSRASHEAAAGSDSRESRLAAYCFPHSRVFHTPPFTRRLSSVLLGPYPSSPDPPRLPPPVLSLNP